MLPNVSIILLNWNGAQDTIACLHSLKGIGYPNYEIILVDNHSDGNDVEIIKNAHGNFIHKIIITDKNLGFSGGNNIGINYALTTNTDYILLLNNDTIVEKDFLSELIKNIEEKDNVGIFTPLINYHSKPNIVWCAGGSISKIRASGFSYGIDRDEKEFRDNRNCTFASGCCMLIKREVIEKIGLLDEKYFLYLEDTDYCARAISAGYKIKFVGSSKIYHKVFSSTAKENKLLPIYYNTRNRLYFAKKNYGMTVYISFIYLIIVFSLKILLDKNKNGKMKKILFLSFKDFMTNKMGKTNIFENS